jgi:hypothetical protein
VRLSKPRLLLRAALLLFLAGFMAWRAVETGRTAAGPGLEPGGAAVLSRIVLIEWFLAGLAVVTAVAALLALREKAPRPPRHLGGAGRADPGQPPEGPGRT